MIDLDLNICTYQTEPGEQCGLPATVWFHGVQPRCHLRGRCPRHIFRYNTPHEVTREEAEVIAVMQS